MESGSARSTAMNSPNGSAGRTRSRAMTWAPERTSFAAVAWPMPEAAPVTAKQRSRMLLSVIMRSSLVSGQMDGLGRQIFCESFLAAFAPETTVLHATERSLGNRDRDVVDCEHPDLQAFSDSLLGRRGVRESVAGQTERSCVRRIDCGIQILEAVDDG